jgi:peptidoglycan/LPS O-acetylase OafA/YrhL
MFSNDSKHIFAALDGWRGVCALLVALLHFPGFGFFYEMNFVRRSGLFVDFFFVLSGFVISFNYRGQIGGLADIRGFMVKRFARLWPLHVTVLLFLIGLEIAKFALSGWYGASAEAPFAGSRSVCSIASNLLLAQVFFCGGWNPVASSISAEFYTYLVFALVTLCFSAGSWRGQALLAAVATIVVVLFQSRFVSAYFLDFFQCVQCFFVGCIVLTLFERTRYLLSDKWLQVLEWGSLALVIAYVSCASTWQLKLLSPLVFGLTVYVFAFDRAGVSALFKSRPLQYLGALSYSIYMIHESILIVCGSALNILQKKLGVRILGAYWSSDFSTSFPVWQLEQRYFLDISAVLYLMVVVFLSGLTFHYIEKRGGNFVKSLAKKYL